MYVPQEKTMPTRNISRREDALKLKTLRMQIKAGVDALERGEFTEVADADLDRYLEGLAATSGKRAR